MEIHSMDLSKAITEPYAQMIEFHNAFNRSIKVSFGAMVYLGTQKKKGDESVPISVPTGNEPWGNETRWRALDSPLREASVFVSEMGIARAAAAFENYLTDAKSEFDRAKLIEALPKKSGSTAFHGFDAILGANIVELQSLLAMAEFFTVARHCVVLRSNCASAHLQELREAKATIDSLDKWPRRSGGWTLSLPKIVEGQMVEWQPRHAIFASDVFYKCAQALDRVLVGRMDAASLARMAAHWCFFADPPAPCRAKIYPERMVLQQMTQRYKARGTVADTIDLLKKIDMWGKVRTAWAKQYPDGPDTSLARKRRAARRRG